jgi:hypothetical protein
MPHTQQDGLVVGKVTDHRFEKVAKEPESMNTNPAQFRKKPVVIEAVQIDRRMDLTSPPWWAEAIQQNRVILRGMGKFTRDLPMVEISTLEGIMTGVQGDWIIRGVQGELYPCKPDIFAATYEPVSAPTSHPIPTGATGERDWELACDECNGSGHVFVKHQVAERKTDVQEFKEECEGCDGRGFNIAFEDIPGIAEYVRKARPAPSAPGDAQEWGAAFDAWFIKRGVWPRVNYEEIFAAGWNARHAPAAGDALLANLGLDAAAKTLAECMDYPWAHMPEQGREQMRKNAKSVIDAAIAQQSQRKEA